MAHLLYTRQSSLFSRVDEVTSVETLRDKSVLISLSSIEAIRELDEGIERSLLTEDDIEKLYGSFRGVQGHMLLYLYKVLFLIKNRGDYKYPLKDIPIYDDKLKKFFKEFVSIYLPLIQNPDTRVSDLVEIAFEEWFRLNEFSNHLNANGQTSFITNEISLDKLKEMWKTARRGLRERSLLKKVEDRSAILEELSGCDVHLEMPVILHLCVGGKELRIYIRLDSFIHSKELDRDKTSKCIDDKFTNPKEFNIYEKLQIVLLTIVTKILSLRKNIKVGKAQYIKIEVNDIFDLLAHLPVNENESNVTYRYFIGNEVKPIPVFVDQFEAIKCLSLLMDIMNNSRDYYNRLKSGKDVSGVYNPNIDVELVNFIYQHPLFCEV